MDNFDYKFYYNRYKDLSNYKTQEDLYHHWINYGKKEGRVCNWLDYDINKNKDINIIEKINEDRDSYYSETTESDLCSANKILDEEILQEFRDRFDIIEKINNSNISKVIKELKQIKNKFNINSEYNKENLEKFIKKYKYYDVEDKIIKNKPQRFALILEENKTTSLNQKHYRPTIIINNSLKTAKDKYVFHIPLYEIKINPIDLVSIIIKILIKNKIMFNFSFNS